MFINVQNRQTQRPDIRLIKENETEVEFIKK